MSSFSNAQSTPPSSNSTGKFQSISARLKLNVVLTLSALLFLAYQGITGMQQAAEALEDLHSQGMQHTIRAGTILAELGSARSSLLLAFQHNPESELSNLHNHALEKHLDSSKNAIQKLHSIIDNEILASPLTPSEKTQVNLLARELDKVTDEGFNPAVAALEEGDYKTANMILLDTINPEFKLVAEQANKFLEMQIAEAKVNYEQTEENSSRFLYLVIILVTFSVIIISLLSFLIIKRTHLASLQLEETANKISQGDLTQRIKLPGDDEFSHIATYVNQIVDSFQHIVESTHESTAKLARSAEENSTVAIQTKQNIYEQQQQTQLIATAIHQFTATVHEVAESASSAAQASKDADDAAFKGQDVVKESITMIESLSNEMQESVVAMQSLAQHAEDIGSVVDVIQSISEQTNLLALNAAIEAARAGEQGRGFAVVADEVRTLASRTQQSTQEILQTIQNLQQGSRDATQRLVQGAENAKFTATEAQKAGDALADITKSVDLINDMNAQIATASEEQSSVTEEINRNITNISDISNQTTLGAEQSSVASSELAELAETMQAEIEAFKI